MHVAEHGTAKHRSLSRRQSSIGTFFFCFISRVYSLADLVPVFPFPVRSVRKSWVQEALQDCRKGYNEVLKVLTRFAAIPVLVVLAVMAACLKGPIKALFGTF